MVCVLFLSPEFNQPLSSSGWLLKSGALIGTELPLLAACGGFCRCKYCGVVVCLLDS